MKQIIKYFKLVPLLVLLCLIAYYNKDITNYIINNYVYYYQEPEKLVPNEYKLNYDFLYIKDTDDFTANNKTELLRIIYTILNNGANNYEFYCEYDMCEYDVNEIASSDILSILNNFVHPYNSYKKVYLAMSSKNRIEISFEKTYTEEEIVLVDKTINEIMDNIINENMTEKEKIIAFHDYIIENTKYDSAYINNNIDDINSPSHKATGILFYNTALCGGYADIMSIFLNKLNIPNYLIASDYHVWNAVYLNNNWYHLDVTWDDPVIQDGSNIRLEKFLLISNDELNSYNTGYHTFDRNIYLEFKILNG